MKRFKNILCVVESGKPDTLALERAVTLAENNQASLTVVAVIERIAADDMADPLANNLQTALVNIHAQKLEALAAPYRQRLTLQTKVLKGTPFLETIREVLRSHCDLVIKSPESQDWLERLFGSDDMHLLRKCPCPVWLIKPQAPHAYRCILAAVDVDDTAPEAELEIQRQLSREIVEVASALALADFAELHIVNVWEAVGESAMRGPFMDAPAEKINAYVERVRQRHRTGLDGLLREVTGPLGQAALDYLKPQTHLIKGSARREIPALAQRLKADLVVMGTVARTGIPGFIMGNTAETILNQIDCSVLAIKPPGFVTPVTLAIPEV